MKADKSVKPRREAGKRELEKIQQELKLLEYLKRVKNLNQSDNGKADEVRKEV